MGVILDDRGRPADLKALREAGKQRQATSDVYVDPERAKTEQPAKLSEQAERLNDKPLQTDPLADLPPLRFFSALQAFQWAESILERPVITNTFQALQRPSGAPFTVEEARDEAHTISALVHAAEPAKGRLLYLLMHSYSSITEQPELFLQSTADLSRVLHARPAARERKRSPQACSLVADFVVANLIREARHQKPFPMAALAREIGIAKQSLKDGGWTELVQDAQFTCAQWLAEVRQAITDELRARGIVV